jgi:hypothetical protein
VAHLVGAIVVELASYEVILGKPWFTRHNPIVDWRQHRLRLKVDCKSVEIDAPLDPQCQGSHAITRILATQLKKVFRRMEPVYLVHLSQMRVDGNPAEKHIAECMGMNTHRVRGCFSHRGQDYLPSVLLRCR